MAVTSKRSKSGTSDKPSSDSWDPRPHQRVWYRHRDTGDRAYLVKRDGKDCIRYDRGDYEQVKLFNEQEWIAEDPEKPEFSPYQIARVTFAADKEFCAVIGEIGKSRREWLNLSDKQRIAWTDDGPQEPRRKRLYQAVKKAMESKK